MTVLFETPSELELNYNSKQIQPQAGYEDFENRRCIQQIPSYQPVNIQRVGEPKFD